MPDSTVTPARSIFLSDVFAFGIGPSSSHTVGPMRAAGAFARAVVAMPRMVVRVSCELFGSLALTGRGHHSDVALIWGLAGLSPDTIDIDAAATLLADIRRTGMLPLAGSVPIAFAEDSDLKLTTARRNIGHPNTLDLTAWFADGTSQTRRYASIGGGAVTGAGMDDDGANWPPFPYESGASLIAGSEREGVPIADLMRRYEGFRYTPAETDQQLDAIRDGMMACIDRGIATDGVLPGGLGVRRRAGRLHRQSVEADEAGKPLRDFQHVSLWALAVNEENAAGGRVVTAPTNGAAGVIPAVLRYLDVCEGHGEPAAWRDFLLTAYAVGALYKRNASISAAEMGCQGEIGVACSMAAAGLAAALGGTARQVANAAEIGMEHNLGLTCDPVGGLVQVPCIERNAMGAIKAINAAHLALSGDGTHIVSLDAVIETMRQTGHDMRDRYKETSQGGLAVNVVEC